MKKNKKIFYGLLPIASIASIVPVVLTSCSVSNSTSNENQNIKPDATNGDKFKPKSKKFEDFEKEYSLSSDKSTVIEKHAKILIKDNDGLSDVIDMWSYNIWKVVKKSTMAHENIKNNYESSINVITKPTFNTNKITTSFLFTSTTKNSEGKIVKAVKKYENNMDGSAIESELSFKLKSSVQEYSIDGVDKKSELEKSQFFNNLKNANVNQEFINGLKSTELTLNVKDVLTKYEVNKTMIWNSSKLGEIGTYDSTNNKLTIDSTSNNLEIMSSMSSYDIRGKLLDAKSKFHNAIDNKPSKDVFNNNEDSFYFVKANDKQEQKIIGQIQIASKNKLFNDLKLNIEITNLT